MRPRVTPSVLMWIGLFAAPFAWAAQHVTGIELQYARCHDNTAGPAWGIPVDAVTIAVSAVAAAIAVIGGLAALAAWRSARGADDDDPPPAGRIHFLAIIGITISPLFLAIIVMSGLGSVFLPTCVQS
jgi:hypothetical protein